MAEISIKIEIPSELKDKFEIILEKILKEFIEELEFSLAKDVISKSKLNEKQALIIAEKIKVGIAKRHGL